MEYVPVRKARQSGTIPVSSACQDENEQLPRISELANKNRGKLFYSSIHTRYAYLFVRRSTV